MQTRCLGWPAPHVPPVVLVDGDGPPSDGMCPACAAVYAITEAAPTTLRLTRFVARLEYDRDRTYLTGAAWSERDRTLHMEKLR